jgi:hypothetical protein
VHSVKARFQVCHGEVYVHASGDYACGIVYYVLRESENSHHKVESMRKDIDGYKGFYYPFIEHKRVYVVHIISFDYHVN